MTIYRGPGGTGEATSDADNTEFQAYVAQAVTAKDAAAVSATAASSSATSAATSATNASNSETSAASSASSASTSATNAAASATTASTQATNAGNSATAAATSATNAATSATSAASSATSASGSASTATTKASEASTSATNAASSATAASASAATATTQATNASSSASAAATSATSASNSASAASTSASAASTSASSAATSATNAASSATAAAGSATSASTSASTATTQASNASTSATNAAASATSASTSASTATTQASNASTSATNAATSATSAATSATSASAAQTAAESARDAALSAYDNFDDRYLGPKASDPTLDNDGNALLTGALYFDTSTSVMRVYTGTVWVAAYVSAAGVLLTANNLSDLNNVATARTNLGLGTAALVADSTLVHKTGDETVAGVKTFSSTIAGSVSGNAGTVTNGVYTTGDQTVAGVKTLSSNPILSAGTANGVPYLNGSKVLTSGSALTFDGNVLSTQKSSSGDAFKWASATGKTAYAYADGSGIGLFTGATVTGTGFYANDTSSYFATYTGGSEQMRLTSTGLGIGTSSPNEKLAVNGAIRAISNAVNVTASAGAVIDYFGGAARFFATDGAVAGQMSLDVYGNLGLGVTPKFVGGYTAFEVKDAALCSSGGSDLELSANAYFNSGWKYRNTFAASRYKQYSGVHTWFNAPSGTAGNAITFTQAMTLDASSNLAVTGTIAATNITAAGNVTGNAATATKLSTAGGGAPSYSARAWVNFNGTGTIAIRASGNVSSITDNGVGDYTVNFTTAMSDANYTLAVQWGPSATYPSNSHGVTIIALASSSANFQTRVASATLQDSSTVCATFFR